MRKHWQCKVICQQKAHGDAPCNGQCDYLLEQEADREMFGDDPEQFDLENIGNK